MKLAVGCDQGFGETGLVASELVDHVLLGPLDWATYKCPPGSPIVSRTVAMANCVVNRILAWVEYYKPEELDIVVELPVYTGNAQTFLKQCRLLQEIESGLFHVVAGEVQQCWLTEVSPSTSKRLAGCGPREKPVKQSPFSMTPEDITQSTREALADAWAHGLSAYGGGGERIALHQLTMAPVLEIHRQGDSRDAN